jgi:hypothetical protein
MPAKSEDKMDARHSLSMTTPTKTSCNSGAGQGKLKAETEPDEGESVPDEECDKLSRNYK